MTGVSVCEACRTRPATTAILTGVQFDAGQLDGVQLDGGQLDGVQLDGAAEVVGLCGMCLDTAGALVNLVVTTC